MRRWLILGAGALLSGSSALGQVRFAHPGFVATEYVAGLSEPTALEFAPDGRLFVTGQRGQIWTVDRVEGGDGPPTGGLAGALFAELSVFSENENGLLGLALDPDFETNGYVYAFATVSGEESQIIRLRDVAGVRREPTVLRGNLPTRGTFHSGGGLKVGPDGRLYFGIGDNLIPENAQDLNSLAGKISRINLDGTTPTDNPLTTPTGAPRSIYALGFRNPFRFCFAPDGRLFVLDVGSDGDGRREEINLVRAGGNYGWPRFEGDNEVPVSERRQSAPIAGARTQATMQSAAFLPPLYSYHDGGAAPVGAVYYSGTHFPSRYQGQLFHIEFVLNRLYLLTLDGDRFVSHETFAEGQDGMLDLAQGPDGALYYCELYGGRVMRIAYDGDATAVAGETADGDGTGATGGGHDASPGAPAGLCGVGALGASVASMFWLDERRRRGRGSGRGSAQNERRYVEGQP